MDLSKFSFNLLDNDTLDVTHDSSSIHPLGIIPFCFQEEIHRIKEQNLRKEEEALERERAKLEQQKQIHLKKYKIVVMEGVEKKIFILILCEFICLLGV